MSAKTCVGRLSKRWPAPRAYLKRADAFSRVFQTPQSNGTPTIAQEIATRPQ